jgi:heptosyltransferase-2
MLVENGIIPVLIGSKQDVNLCDKICKFCPDAINLAGILSLRQTYKFLKNCTGIVTNDSAPLHLGLAAEIPVYAIFGSTVPEFGFAPFGKNDCIIEDTALACRPCGIHGRKKCPVKTFDCMNNLTPAFVLNKIINRPA